MKSLVVGLLCLGLLVAARGRPPRPTRARQLESRKRNEVPPQEELPIWEPQPTGGLRKDQISPNQLLEGRQYYPSAGGTPEAGYPSSENEIPRPIPPSGRPPKPPKRPRPSGCARDRGQFASPRSCAHYMNCWDGLAVEQVCPHGLLFNEEMSYCDHDYNVQCGTRPGNLPKPALPDATKRCPDPHGRYRSSVNCSEFFICLGGSPIKFACPEGLVYNEEINVCDFIGNVDCRGAVTPLPLPGQDVEEDWNYDEYPNVIPGSPGSSGQPVQPEVPSKPSQGAYPGQGGYPSQGGYPAQGGYPGQGAAPPQGAFPGSAGQVGGLPASTGRPTRPPRPTHAHPTHPTHHTRPPRPSRPHHRPTSPRPTPSSTPQVVYPPESVNPNPPYPAGAEDFPDPSPYNSLWSSRTSPEESQQRQADIPVDLEAELAQRKVFVASKEEDQQPQQQQQQEQEQEQPEPEEDVAETSTITLTNPWNVVHKIPDELVDAPCEDGDVKRLDESCTSVVLCRDKRHQLLNCQTGYTYDKPSDSCRPFNLAKC